MNWTIAITSRGPGAAGRTWAWTAAIAALTLAAHPTSAAAVAPTVVSALPDTLVLENAPSVDDYRDLNAVFADAEDGSALAFSIQGNTNPALVSVSIDADSALDLSFAADQYGSATIVIRATDAELLSVQDTFVVAVHHTLWRVHADGTGDAPTIQAALNATIDGDTVLLSDGVYTGGGNRGIVFNGREILLTSENGPATTIIDCQGADRGFSLGNGEGPGTVVSGFTLMNASKTNGGGFHVSGASPTIRGIVVVGCTASRGAAFYFDGGSASVLDGVVCVGNAADDGGAIFTNGSPITIANCTFVENASTSGTILFRNSAGYTLSNSIVAFATQGPGIGCALGADPAISCTDVFGNAGGDALCGTDGGGNISADPQFCGSLGSGIVTISSASPCAPANNACGVLMGAEAVACAPGTPPLVAVAIPDTAVAKNSAPIDDYRDLNDVFADAEDGDSLAFSIHWNSNPALVAATIDADSAIDLAFTPGRSGVASIAVRAADSTSLSVVDTFVVTVVPTMLSASASRVWTGPVRPGGAPQPMFLLTLSNNDAAPETLTAVTFTNVTSGAGTQAQLDSSFASLTLDSPLGAGILPGGAPGPVGGSFAAGRLTFANLAAEVPPGGAVSLVVSGGASLSARDGDVLDLALASAADIEFTDSVTTVGAWPLDTADAFPVDGFVAQQTTLHVVPATTFATGSVHNVALDVTLPSNGYAADVLNRINVINLGSAAPVTDVAAMEAWVDDGDGVFDEGSDTRLGSFSYTGARWERTGLARAVPPGGVRVFVTVDVASAAIEGSTIRLGLPTAPDLGAGMNSGNDGPLDAAVVNPFAQSIVSSEGVVLAAVPLSAATVNPGARGVLVLQLTATNNYATSKDVTRLVVTNGATASGLASQADLDGETERLELRIDGNDNGVLDDAATDPVAATAFFNAGTATFNALSWSIPPGASRHAFVTADVSLDRARDADVLGVFVDDVFDVEFADATAIIADWPVDSGAPRTVDGMLAAQVTVHDVASLTLAPADGPVLALDLTLPANGYAADALGALEVVDMGTASPSDLGDVRLWRDGGDGVFSAGGGDDVEVSPFVWVGGSWRTPVLAEALPPGGARVFVGVTVAAAPTDSATVRLAVPVGGATVASGNDGPIDSALESPQGSLITTAPLLASLVATPGASVVGQGVTVRMVARNVGGEPIDGVTPSALAVTGDATFAAPSGPAPASFNLAPGAVDTFTWVYVSTAAGTARWTGSCAGVGNASGLPRIALEAASNAHDVFDASGGIDVFPFPSMPLLVSRGQTDVVPLSLTFSAGNAVTSSARLLALRIRLESGTGAGIVPAELLERVVVGDGATTYLTKSSLETSGATVDLVFAAPALVSSAAPVTLALRLDVLATTTVPDFRVVVVDSTWFTAVDAISGAPVAVALTQGAFPIATGVARLVVPPTALGVGALPATTQRAGWGQTDVAVLPLRLDNAGIDGVTTNVAVASVAVTVTDTNGVAVPSPSALFSQLRLVGPLGQLFSVKTLGPFDGSVVELSLSPLASVVVNAPLDLTVFADVAGAAGAGAYRVRLAPAATFDARDATTLASVPVVYAVDPVEGADVRIEAPAESLVVDGVAAFPPTIAVGESNVAALDVVLRHPGTPGVSRVRVDALTVRCQDEARDPVVPASVLSRLRVVRGGAELANVIIIPTSGDAVPAPFPAIFLEPGQSDTLEVLIDASATAPESFLELVVDALGVAAADANAGSAVVVAPEAGSTLPLTSGLAHLLPPATELVVGLESRMPVALVAGAGGIHVADVSMKNTASIGSSSVTVERLVVRAADRNFSALSLGGVAARVTLHRALALVAASDTLDADSTTATLAFSPPLTLSPQEAASLELRVDFKAGAGGTDGFRVGFTDTDVGVDQPASALLKVRVEALPGRTFPFWTEAGSFGAASPRESFSNYPNPFAAGAQPTTFVYYLPQDGEVTLRVWTVRGERVATIRSDSRRGAGLYQDDQWSGRNGRGTAVVNGAYIAELVVRYADGTSERLLRKVAVVR